MTKKELKRLRKKLPKRWADKLSTKYRVSVSYIRAIVYGQKNNPPILADACRMAEEYQESLVNLKQKVNSL